MGFIKHASVQSLGTATFSDEGLKKVAASEGADAGVAPSTKSYYIDGARKVDVRAMLKEAGPKFDISTDPAHYFFEAIRANSVNVPNENHDAFHRNELLRFDTRRGMPVYLTYVGKPHHLDHKTDNPKRARGVILDSHYNDETPALEHCPTCNYRTAEESGRDPSGIHCAKCATVVKDEFIEILVAVDTNKDPDLARGIQAGVLNAGSMGCFLPGTPITLADGTRIPIEDIRPGDSIITHSGAVATVGETSVHEHEDSIYRVYVQGHQDAIAATGNHPFWVVDSETGEGSWVDADKLQVGQYLRCPAVKTEEVFVESDFARLVGYFLAEGNYIKAYDGPLKGQRVGLEFSFSIEEDHYVEEVVSLLRKYGNDPSVYTRPSRNLKVVKDYRCLALTERMVTLVGQHAVDKTLAPEVLSWPKEAQLNFIGAWLNGDGYSIHDAKHSWSGITTASADLRDQLSQMLVNLGIPHRHRYQPSSFGGRLASEIIISGNPQLELKPYSDKVKRPHGVVGKTATLADSQGLLRRITSIDVEEYTGPVYNFEVEHADHSYVAGGVAVHNCNCASTVCNVCNHVAKSVNDFCLHIRGSAKGTLWREVEANKFERISGDGVRALLREAGYRPSGEGNQLVQIALEIPERNIKVRKAFEYCQGVEFDEYSRVHRPADPKARTVEILKAAAENSGPLLSIKQETEQLIIRARLAQQEALMSKSASENPNARIFHVARVNGDDEHLSVHPSFEALKQNLRISASDKVEYAQVAADSLSQAIVRATKSAQYLPMQGDVNLVVPDGVRVQMMPNGDASMPGAPGAQPGGPGQPGAPGQPPAPSIEDVTQDEVNPKDPQQSPEEFGMLPPGASAPGLTTSADSGAPDASPHDDNAAKDDEHMEQQEQKYAAVYGDFEVEVFDNRAVVSAPGGDVVTVKSARKLDTDDKKLAFGNEVLDSFLNVGLVRTALKYEGSFDKRVADATEGAMWNMAGGRPQSNGGALEGAEQAQAVKPQAGRDVVTNGGGLDGAEWDNKGSRPRPKNSIESRNTERADHNEVASPKTNALKGHEEAQKHKRPEGGDSALAGGTTDMKANAGGDSSPKIASVAPTSSPSAEAKATEERVRKLYAARIEKMKVEHEAELRTLRAAEQAKVFRALRIAQRRAALNIEESPLKASTVDSLTVPRAIGRSAATGQPVEFQGLDEGLALHLVEAAWEASAQEDVEALIERTAELLSYEDSYLVSAERDLAKQAAIVPPVVIEEQLSPANETQRRAAALRAQAAGGNLTLASGATDSDVAEDKVIAIRAALGPTKVGRLHEDFSPNA